MDVPTAGLLAVPFLIALNAFFVASEYALVAIRPVQIEAMRRRGRLRSAEAMQRLKDDPASAIAAIQICITMTNLLLGWIGEPAMSAVLAMLSGPLVQRWPGAMGGVSLALSFLVVTLLTVVFGELLPKAMTLRFVARVAGLTARPVAAIERGIRPLVWLMNGMANLVTRPLGLGRVQEIEQQRLTPEELRLITAQAAADGALSPRERSLILNTLGLGSRPVRRIVVPRMKVAFLDLQKSMDENREVMNAYLYSRMPLCDGGIDKVMGVVHTKEFLAAYNAAGDVSVLSLIARPAVFVPETTTVDRLLSLFHERRTQLAFVVDEHGGVEGIVTLRDVVDELLGEVVPAQAPADADAERQPALPIRAEAQRPVVVEGQSPLHELAAQLGRPDWAAGTDAATVGGLVLDRLGRLPRAGEEVDVDGVLLHVIEADERAVRRVRVETRPPRQ